MVIIVDGNNLACRCYFAIKKDLSTSDGHYVKMIYSFLNSFKSYVKRYGSENNFCVVWDSQGKKVRHDLYPEYKANRSPFPSEFYEQINIIIKVLEALNIPQYKIPNTEADDIVCSLVYQSRKKGQKVLIISGDHDFEQLINNHVKIVLDKTAKADIFFKDIDYVANEYGGLVPSQLVDFFSMIGDTGDNIFGIEGVGEVTAAKLLKIYGTVENIFSNVDTLKISDKNGQIKEATDNLKNKFKTSLDKVNLNKKLITLVYSLDVKPNYDYKRGIEKEKLIDMFEQLEFKSFLKNFDDWEKVFR